MKVTIRDVAKEAGVAPSTVSRVLSNSERISEETKAKVREAIKKLNFKPNAIARSLANNKTQTLGIMLPNEIENSFSNPFFIQVMQGISLYASQYHYYVMYAFAKDKKDELKYVKELTDNRRVDGIVILKAEVQDKTIAYLQEMKFPFVVIGHPEKLDETLWVDNDNIDATYRVTEELIKCGHRTIGFVGANTEWAVSKDRYEGYKRALQAYGIDLNKRYIYHGKEFNELTGEEAAKRLVELDELTAIITTDDLIAVGIKHYFDEVGIDSKELIGFNNTAIGAYQNPPLSSVDINAEKLGWYAGKLIIGQLEEKRQEQTHYIVETEFIKRKSK
ncbi:LacI family DNA-binding transcriptional regulator [Niameybacter massiliensis]|uniref:LacI family DNA-binding transcriptional regulator n=1 Tax=Niameybacter massiliensis TaxID=1658108 RepID=UPI0006B4DEF6|nr:LacI family DNA-binding transcriptional regulator [Niameybacter massiliensis]